MYSRFPPDMSSNEQDAHQSAKTDCDFDSLLSIDRNQHSDHSHITDESTGRTSAPDQGPTIIQMAFIQLMTQKVIEATANCPEVLKHLNSKIRTDQD